jgi:hypothetical protein
MSDSKTMEEHAERNSDTIMALLDEVMERVQEIKRQVKLMNFHYKQAICLAAKPFIAQNLLQSRRPRRRR